MLNYFKAAMIYQPKIAKDDSKYIIDARWTLGIRQKYFFVFLFGRDQRGKRIGVNIDRRKNSTVAKAIVYSGIVTWLLACSLCVIIVLLYIVKSRMGIDLVPDDSPLPEFLLKIGVCH